jgi:hypothetical protein
MIALDAPQADWRLTYEKSNFLETGRYAEAAAYVRRLDEASPIARAFTIGNTPEGRSLDILMISKDRRFTAAERARSQKPLILVVNGIHSGEIEGKDASLILARRMLIEGRYSNVLDKVDIAILPIYNADGHERFSAYNRVNQNGPKEMGWRTNSINLNLNRDFVKADSPETKALIKFMNGYRPDFFFDNHTTDGGDWQYHAAYSVPMGPTQDPSVAAWSKRMVAAVTKACGEDGHPIIPYFGGFNAANPASGITVSDFSPRYSTGYGAAINRPTMLIETHVLKPYKLRVETTFSMVLRTLEFCAQDAAGLIAANQAADRRAGQGIADKEVVVEAGASRNGRPIEFLAYAYTPYESEISGATIPKWDRSKPMSVQSVIRDTMEPRGTVRAAYAYVIPAAWKEAIERLETHGIAYRRIPKTVTGNFDTYRLQNVVFPRIGFEGRFNPRFEAVLVREKRTLPEGSAIVWTAQRRGKMVVHLLEPMAPDSLASWGFFNSVFEEKDFFEDYAMEPIAKEMMEKDPKLRAEFQERLKDPNFANSPRQRLAFFYDKSAYADVRLNKYPVIRVSAQEAALFR